MDRQLIRGVLVALLAIACSSKRADPVEPPGGSGSGSGSEPVPAAAAPPVVTDGDGAKAHAGNAVLVQGTARNAKLSAAVVANSLVVYCLGVDSWPTDVSGKPITARGKLEETKEFASDGDSAGTSGAVWVLRDCRYDP